MAEPVCVAVSGGVPVVDATPGSGTPATGQTLNGFPVTPVDSGARPITIVASGAPPVVFISADGTEYLPGGVSDPLTPDAPVLTWDTDGTDNTPSFTGDFDDTMVHDAGSIDGSNYDVIHLEWDTDSGFGSVDNDSNTLDAAEILAGEVAFTTGTLADGLWYARCRHEHVVAGVSHFSPWSNTVSQTIETATSAGEAIGLLLVLTKAA